ncbi:MAG: sigma-70 family RNA polymerase sigma factor [Sedimentisphaerales bacterium]|nr:sigma-70 family RNA polymerase sigma factor [Sedimentisphaerales bacterium]MBN2843651.1 sigma-70 family RNA polymerase sigma factor [Sedimentisphaerales bacterium]
MDELENQRSQYFMQLFLKSQRRIYGYVMAKIASPVDADDIVQETASLLWQKFDDYTPGTDFTAWAISVARFKILRYLRDKKNYRMKFSDKTMEIIEQLEAIEAGDEDIRIESLKKCLQKLNPDEKKILELRYEDGATLKALSGRVGININTLYNRISKIHVVLLNCVKKSMTQ